MDLREARAGAVRKRYRDLRDSLPETLPKLLDDLERIDRQFAPEPLTVNRAGDVPSGAELTAWIEEHPDEFAAWVRKRDRIEGAPARPARTRRPRGGATA